MSQVPTLLEETFKLSTPPAQISPLRSLARHPRWAIVAPMVILGVTVLVILFAPRKYSSDAKLFLRIGRESVSVDPTALSVGDPMSLHLTREHEIESEIGVMQSDEILGSVIDRLGPEFFGSQNSSSLLGKLLSIPKRLDPIPDRERTMRDLQENFNLDASSKSSVVTISYHDDDPQRAEKVVATWIEAYRDHHANLYRNQGSLDFFAGQQSRLESLLLEARQKRRDAKNRYGLMTLEGGQRSIEERILELEKSLAEAQAQFAAKGGRTAALDQMIRSDLKSTIESATTGKANTGRDLVRAALFELEVTQEELQSRLVEGHPKLDAIANQIRQAQNIVDSMENDRTEVTSEVNPSYQVLSQSLMSDQADKKGLASMIDQQKESLASLRSQRELINQGEAEVSGLDDEVKILERRYVANAEQYERARMEETLAKERMTSIAVVQAPTQRHKPVSPNKAMVLLMGILAAGLAMVAGPVLIDQHLLANQQHSNEEGVVIEKQPVSPEWDFRSREQDIDRSAAESDAKTYSNVVG